MQCLQLDPSKIKQDLHDRSLSNHDLACRNPQFCAAQEAPYRWKHANLGQLERYLREQIQNKSFVPTFPFEPAFL